MGRREAGEDGYRRVSTRLLALRLGIAVAASSVLVHHDGSLSGVREGVCDDSKGRQEARPWKQEDPPGAGLHTGQAGI